MFSHFIRQVGVQRFRTFIVSNVLMDKTCFYTGGGFGDPHIKTLDKRTYTFNGHGEYIMLDIPSAPFQLQCRTARAVYKDNSLSDATVYSGFAAREDPTAGTLLQVELNEAKDGRSCVTMFQDKSAIQSNFNGLNIFGTIEISSRYG